MTENASVPFAHRAQASAAVAIQFVSDMFEGRHPADQGEFEAYLAGLFETHGVVGEEDRAAVIAGLRIAVEAMPVPTEGDAP